jgi:chloride channel protein, CIC family
MTLREVLHAHIPTLSPESTVRDAVDKMDIYQFPALAVVDERMAPLAVITEGDLCRAASQNDNLTSMAYEPAIRYATPQPVVMPPDTDIGDAFHRMLSSGLTVLPVVEEERVVGIVLRVDLMQAMLMDIQPAETS